MELYTFIHIGGERERITVVELVPEARAALAKFDASKAQCYLRKDREKLLAVVEAGYGDLVPFNKEVRGILRERRTTQRRERPSTMRRLATHMGRRSDHAPETAPSVIVLAGLNGDEL